MAIPLSQGAALRNPIKYGNEKYKKKKRETCDNKELRLDAECWMQKPH